LAQSVCVYTRVERFDCAAFGV